MGRLINKDLIELANIYNLSLTNITTWKPRKNPKSSQDGYYKKIGFEFSTINIDKVDKIYFYGKLSEYNYLSIENTIKTALQIFQTFNKQSSMYYYVRLNEEKFVESKNNDFFESTYYIKNIEKYLRDI